MRSCTFAILGLLLTACARESVDWDDPAPLPASLGTTADIAFDEQHRLVARAAPALQLPIFTGQCAATVRVARDSTGDWYAAWWAVRADSTADVAVSRSTDGVTWAPAVRVDSTDVGRVGCTRAAPSIYAEGGNVHVAYAMHAKEGPGVFTSHSMDRGLTFHTAVPIVYGERIGLAAIASRGDLVAVAYEDPNSSPARIGLALSRTMGHAFESRMLVSPDTGPARAPTVAVGDGTIAVAWATGPVTDASSARVVRIGELR